MKKAWRLLAKALGSKEGDSDREADTIAIIRLIYVIFTILVGVSILIANLMH